jgi:hypothetical protein
MAGLSLMALGPYQFQALGFGFNARQKSQRTPWATVAVAGGMNRVQWTGGEGRTETIGGAIFKEFGGEAALAGIEFSAARGIPLTLVDMSGGLQNVFGLHVVEEVSQDQSAFDAFGAALKSAYAIKLRRFEGSPLSAARVPVLSLFA